MSILSSTSQFPELTSLPPALKEKGKKNNIHLGTFKCKTKQTQISYHIGLTYNGHLFNIHYMCLVWFFLHASLSSCISQVHGQKKRQKEMHLQFYLKFIQLLKCFLTFSFDVKLLGAVDNFKLSQSSQMIERASPACFPQLFPQVTTRQPSPLGHQPGRYHSQHIIREQGQRDRPISTRTYALSNIYLLILSFMHRTHSVIDCIGACGERKPNFLLLQ